MPRLQIRYSKAADAEYRAIIKESRRHGSVNWYRQRIRAALRAISDHPEIGMKCDYLLSDLRKFPVESHRIYYRVVDNVVLITHLLHHLQSEGRGDWDAGD